MAIEISAIQVQAGRFKHGDSDSVQQQRIGVRFTMSSVVFYDIETDDQWLTIGRDDFKQLYGLSEGVQPSILAQGHVG